MGNILMTTTGIGMFIGMNSAMETLVSQAHGAGNKQLCGIYLWRGRICLLILFTFIWGIFCVSGVFLKLVGQNEEVADSAYIYIIWSFPSIVLMGLSDLQRKFLIEVGKS